MAKVAPIPRSRGSLCGLALIALGAWAGLAPYAGPNFGYGLASDRAWAYTQGKLYLSALPGAVALVAGLGIMITRRRGLGGLLAVIAALAGAWLIVGGWAVQLLPASLGGAITAGSPVGSTVRQVDLTYIGSFWGAGALIVFFAALALGRFSIAALKDQDTLGAFVAGAASGAVGTSVVASAGYQPAQGGYATTQPQYAADQYASYSPGAYPAQYPPDQYQPDQYQPAQYAPQYPAEQYPAEQFPAQQFPAEQPQAEQHPPTVAGSDPGTATQTQFPTGP